MKWNIFKRKQKVKVTLTDELLNILIGCQKDIMFAESYAGYEPNRIEMYNGCYIERTKQLDKLKEKYGLSKEPYDLLVHESEIIEEVK